MSRCKDWQGKGYSFFQNERCEYFPCHGIENGETFHAAETGEGFNCLFCFCPLYGLDDCGGKFTYLDNGKKECIDCLIPHRRDNYGYIMDRLMNATEETKSAV